MARTHVDVLAVTDDQNRFSGMISATDFTGALERSEESFTAKDLAVLHPIRVLPDQTLRVVIATLVDNDVSQAPAVARWDERRLLSMISQHDVLREFAVTSTSRGALMLRPRVLRLVGAIQVEHPLNADSPLVGIELKDLHLPQEAVITTIHRQGVVVIPRGAVQLEAGNVISAIAEPAVEPAVRRLLAGEVLEPLASEAVPNDSSAAHDGES